MSIAYNKTKHNILKWREEHREEYNAYQKAYVLKKKEMGTYVARRSGTYEETKHNVANWRDNNREKYNAYQSKYRHKKLYNSWEYISKVFLKILL